MIHGIIYSLLWTYHRQNSDYSDFVHFSQLLFQRHLLQGWDTAFLKKVFFSALQKITTKRNIPNAATTAAPDSNKKQAFFHMEFHPGDIPRRDVRKIYTDTCEEIFKDRLDIEKFTIAYSRPKTIGSVITKAQLFEVEGREVSKYLTGELQE